MAESIGHYSSDRFWEEDIRFGGDD